MFPMHRWAIVHLPSRVADLDSVAVGTARDREDPVSEKWNATMKDGHTQRTEPSDLREMSRPDIIELLRSKEIHIQ